MLLPEVQTQYHRKAPVQLTALVEELFCLGTDGGPSSPMTKYRPFQSCKIQRWYYIRKTATQHKKTKITATQHKRLIMN